MKTKISIVVPVYGVEQFLPQCIESLLAQTYKDIEIILVDDGSPDGCPSICDAYYQKDNRIKIIHKKNEGVCIARQTGVDNASGEYVVFVDGDDWIDYDYVENIAIYIDKYNPDVISCGYKLVNHQKQILIKPFEGVNFYDRESIENHILPLLMYRSKGKKPFPTMLWAKAFKMDLYKQNQLTDTDINIGEDRACAISAISNANSLAVIDNYGYNYRMVASSLTRGRRPFKTYGPKVIYEHVSKHIDLNKAGLRTQLYNSTTHSLFNVCKSVFFSNNGYLANRKKIKEILQEPVYQQAIQNADYGRSFSLSLMRAALKYKLTSFIYLYSRFK